ncbi:MAG: hypothetical protein ACXVIF_07670 [Halobacteriota archaeon]
MHRDAKLEDATRQLKWQHFSGLFEWRGFLQLVVFGFLGNFFVYLRVRSLVVGMLPPFKRRKT